MWDSLWLAVALGGLGGSRVSITPFPLVAGRLGPPSPLGPPRTECLLGWVGGLVGMVGGRRLEVGGRRRGGGGELLLRGPPVPSTLGGGGIQLVQPGES